MKLRTLPHEIKSRIKQKAFRELVRRIENPALQDKLHAHLMDELLKKDPNYDLSKVPLFFANRKNETTADQEMLVRICQSYKKAKEAQSKAGPEYTESNEWAPIYRHYMQPIMTAFMTENIGAIRKAYQNFWRDNCSIGLVGLPEEMEAKYFKTDIAVEDAKKILRDVIWRYRLWRELVPEADVSALQSPNIGNPYGYFVSGQFVRGGCDYHHYYTTQIQRLMKFHSHKTVAEIGGGYGGMAYYLMRDTKNLTYVDLDLPENMALTAYYLLSAFPEKRIALYGEVDVHSADLRAYDAIILPSFEIERLPAASVDLVFNSYSLAEMSKETIDRFVKEIGRTVRSCVLHVNHNRNSVVKADNFGIEAAGFSLVYKIQALWNYGVNRNCDEYEYLYQRVPGQFATG